MAAFAIPLALAGLGVAAVASTRGGESSGTLLTSPQQATGTGAQPRTPGGPRTDNRRPTENAQQTGRTAQPRPPRTDNRRPGPNAQQTGRTAVPRGSSSNTGADADRAAGVAQSFQAGKRVKRRLGSARPGTLLTGSVIPADLSPRTLLGY